MKDIALIGVSVKCSKAETLEQFQEIVSSSVVCMDQPSSNRITNSHIEKQDSFLPYGYLDRVDYFDHHFFDLSKAEANAMDPNQRLLLQGVVEAIEKSGYSLNEFEKLNSGLFVSTICGVYNFIYQSSNNELDFIGGLSALASGRIAHFLDINGPVMNIDTACSSTLVATHEAIQKLKNKEIDIALVAGSRVLFQFEMGTNQDDAIMSSDGICKAFDNEASGTSGGEGVAVIILKRVEDAIVDKNPIISIIKGSAINNDGKRSSSLTAPSPIAQTDVILNACENAQVDISTVGYIETHGTGTKLGDPIEYKAIDDAFKSSLKDFNVRLGTLKPNIGHLDNVSGLFGLIKASLVLKQKEFFPLANFNSLNQFIQVNPNIIVEKAGEKWESKSVRRAGVSSFGLSGTNAHIILEEYIEKSNVFDGDSRIWMKLSAKKHNVLKEYIEKVSEFLDSNENLNLSQFAMTMNSGRDDFDYRMSFSAYSLEELKSKLNAAKNVVECTVKIKPKKSIALLILSDCISNYSNFINDKDYDKIFNTELSKIENYNLEKTIAENIALRTSLYKYFIFKGFDISQFIGNGDVAKSSKLFLNNAFNKEIDLTFEDKFELDFDKLNQIIQNLKEDTQLIVLTSNKDWIDKINNNIKLDQYEIIDLYELIVQNGWESFWSNLYYNGVIFNWNEFYTTFLAPKILAPTYPFEKVSCWNEIKNPLIISTSKNDDVSSDLDFEDSYKSIEYGVLKILETTLQLENIQFSDDFFELGGNSIVGVQFINRINNTYDTQINFEELYDCYDIKDIVELVKNSTQIASNDNIENNQNLIDDELMLAPSNSQKRMWFESQIDELSLSYNIGLFYKFEGNLDFDIFSQTLFEIIERHINLRSSFVLDDSGNLLQRIQPVNQISANDFISFIETDDLEEISKIKNAIQNHRFDLNNGPLFKASIVKVNNNQSKIIFVFHHIIFDGWSVGVFLTEFASIYQQLLGESYNKIKKTNNYVIYLDWLNNYLSSTKIEDCKLYWKNNLSDISSQLQLGKININSFEGNRKTFVLDKDLKTKIKNFAQTNRTTPFTVLVAAIRSCLYRLSNENFVIGTPVTGRVKEEFENEIGLFVNTLPLYSKISDEDSFKVVLDKEKSIINKALEYQSYPYDMILNDANIMNKETFFDVMVIFQNQNSRNGLLKQENLPFDIELDHTDVETYFSRFKLTYTFFEIGDEIELELEYKTQVFDEQFINDLIESFLLTLNSFIINPEKELKDQIFISDNQFDKIVNQFNSSQILIPPCENIIQHFERQVLKTPDNIAVIFNDKKLTYDQLNKWSNALANYLRNHFNIKANDLIAVKFERNEYLPAVLLGILKSGAAYLPIDVNYPPERISYIEKDCGAKLIIDSVFLYLFEELKLNYLGENLENNIQQNDLAYVIYTSGTTGNPKGVLIDFEFLYDYVNTFSNYFNVSEKDSALFQSSISFDTSIEEIFPVLLNGGKLIVAPNTKDFFSLFELCNKHSITLLSTNPYLVNYLNSECFENLGSLRTIISGGDVLKSNQVDNLYQRVSVYNTYGPTETTVCATYHLVKTLSDPLPIGKPINNKKVYILDSTLKPVPIGVKGEIYISGKGVSKGYLNRISLTSEKFIDNPFETNTKMYRTGDMGAWQENGDIQFYGRNDSQVKIRGYRIELNEIEKNMLLFSTKIQNTFVDLAELDNESVLVAYFTSTTTISKNELRRFLLEYLPEFMVPSYYIQLENFIITSNGKIDKKQLPKVTKEDSVRNNYVQARNPIEIKLVEIWGNLLNIEKVSVLDHFFDLGGHSLIATRLINVIHKEFDIRITVEDLFKNLVLEDLGILLENLKLLNEKNQEVEFEGIDTEIFSI